MIFVQAGISKYGKKTKRFYKRVNTPLKKGFILPIGVEYTYLAKKWSGIAKVVKAIRKSMRKSRVNLGFGFSVYDDCGPVIEITSPVHKNMNSLKRFYAAASDSAKKKRLPAYSKARGGGGAHINVSIPRVSSGMDFTYTFLHNLMVDIGNRPYLNWIFNEATDNHTANCMWACNQFRNVYYKNVGVRSPHKDFAVFARREPESLVVNGLADPYSFDVTRKNFAVRIDAFRVELRIFDMFRNELDLVDSIKFVEAYMEYIFFISTFGLLVKDERIKLDTTPLDRFYSITKIKDLSFFKDTAENDFYSLLELIGLDRVRYSKFCRRNLDARIKLGNNYLV